MAAAVERCVHCGFCLPSCPTYLALGEEMDSPRGRILLMKEVLEGEVELNQAARYIDRCLGCLGCVTACPSGVEYGELLTPFRMMAESSRHRSIWDRLVRRMVLATLPYPRRFRLAVRFGSLARWFRRLVPGRLGAMLDLLPAKLPNAKPLPDVFPAHGPRRAKVALLAGCVQQVLAPEINWATLRVLAHNGVEVVIPRQQVCCGALAAHTGVGRQAEAFARQNVRVFPPDVDAIVTNAAGCGSGMHEYPLWLRGQPEEKAAGALSGKVKDVCAFLMELGPLQPGAISTPRRVAYHDSCHLAHAQRVRSQPRQLLAMIPGLEVVEIPEGEICCGSAGTYNLEQPAIARDLGQRKAATILATSPDAVACGNIGCMMQIQTHLLRQGRSLPVYHTVQLLDLGYANAQ
jgi:glycolate oxidase iron-sulfur subunit